jgi:hypothetical protein
MATCPWLSLGRRRTENFQRIDKHAVLLRQSTVVDAATNVVESVGDEVGKVFQISTALIVLILVCLNHIGQSFFVVTIATAR